VGSVAKHRSVDEVPENLGLIAGAGVLPIEVAKAARSLGCRVVAAGLHGVTDPGLADEVDDVLWLEWGQLGELFAHFAQAGVRDVTLAGKIAKTHLYGENPIALDAVATTLLHGVADRGDASILSALAEALSQRGLYLRPQAEWLPDLLPGEGPLGSVVPTAEQTRDIEYGWRIARELARNDVGQCVVVSNRAIIAVEAIEGTDAAIRRAGEMGGAGGCVVKVARPDQDPRFDLPAVGPETLRAMIDAGARVLAFEAGRTLVFERRVLVASADDLGIAIVGVHPSRVPQVETSAGGREVSGTELPE
jgi:DUF1009 family protein